MGSPSGSSPHTRGLHAGAPRGPARRGIIPAHAGFTLRDGGQEEGAQDHPRTRGVYLSTPQRDVRLTGSSPHTRGLLPPSADDQIAFRIIPAHAGFTSPRRVAFASSRGSSPHTRGLRYFFVADMLNDRIIPAHAGFTPRAPSSAVMARDHPRTRGVYVCVCVRVCVAVGSSPHTRGLPCGSVLCPAPRGIIPAHAGFTDVASDRGVAARDHPRTRGVYHAGPHAGPHAAGSSPHTRGLPRARGRMAAAAGIIPAHAGFTRSGPPPPSSRSGSSPHTRGLPIPDEAEMYGGGIIPAHAGFTAPGPVLLTPTADHPRTRGVY